MSYIMFHAPSDGLYNSLGAYSVGFTDNTGASRYIPVPANGVFIGDGTSTAGTIVPTTDLDDETIFSLSITVGAYTLSSWGAEYTSGAPVTVSHLSSFVWNKTEFLNINVRPVFAPGTTTDANYGGIGGPPAVPTGGGNKAICFLKDAPVLTPSGYRRIADLRVGDLVQTPEGTTVPIQAVKIQQHVRPSQAVNPYVIPKGQYGATKELLISPEHKVLANGAMVEAKFLGLKQAAMADSFDYYNLELPNYEQMVVAGVVVESLYPLVRVKVSMAQFKQALTAKYGAITPELLAGIKNKIRVHADGNVELLTLKRLTK